VGQIVFVPKEVDSNEPRVAASPDTVKRISGLGLEVVVETGAGAPWRDTAEELAQAGGPIGKA
jgi:NAD(P) transhydrogenase subunit alpha